MFANATEISHKVLSHSTKHITFLTKKKINVSTKRSLPSKSEIEFTNAEPIPQEPKLKPRNESDHQ